MKPEERLQSAIVRYFALQYPDRRGLLFSNHNNANSAAQGAKAVQLGRVAGVADMTYLRPSGKPLFIELKQGKGKQSPAQVEWQKMVEAHGYEYVIVRSLDEAIKIFSEG